MAKVAELETILDSREVWICEGCGQGERGVDPPDECLHCGHTYFDNLQDVRSEAMKNSYSASYLVAA